MANWMSGIEYYSNDLTPEDEIIGFKLLEVLNPLAEFADEVKYVTAVVFAIGSSDRIIKLKNPDGKPSYQHQFFGMYGDSGRNDWKPVQIAFPSAVMAIHTWQAGRDNIGDPIFPKVEPGDPGGMY